MLVKDFANEFRALLGDETQSIDDSFIITGLNWALRDLPVNPKLDKIFSHHFTVQLDAKRHWRWDLACSNTTETAKGAEPYFDYILDVLYLNAWTSTGGDVCRLDICPVSVQELYATGLPNLMEAGKPCKYALERDEDKLYFTLDRPSDVPVILDYVATGMLREVKSMDDEVPITRLCANTIMSALQGVWYQSATDMAFSRSILEYADNKLVPQLVQEINRRFSSDKPVVLGG